MKILANTIGLIVVALVVAACGTTLDFEDGEVVVNSNFSITEEMLNSGDTSVLTLDDTELVRNAEYDIQEGVVVITGDFACDTGNRRERGEMTVLMEATEDGFINVEITDAQADCDLPGGIIERAQEEMANGLAEAAREIEDSNATINFSEFTLADDTLTIAFEARVPVENQE